MVRPPAGHCAEVAAEYVEGEDDGVADARAVDRPENQEDVAAEGAVEPLTQLSVVRLDEVGALLVHELAAAVCDFAGDHAVHGDSGGAG